MMRHSFVPALVLAFVPLLAFAAPKKKHRPLKRPAVTAPATPAPAPEPSPEAAPADSSAPSDAPATPPPAPAAPPPPPAKEEAPQKSVDLDGLTREYNQLRDELFRSRSKAQLVGGALFKTKINATFKYKAERAWPLKKVTLLVDDQPVFTADAPSTTDPLKLFDGFVAPGKHALALKVECGAAGESRVGYGAEGTFTVDVAENKETKIAFVVDETGSGPDKIAKKREGDFDVRVRAELVTAGK